MIVKLRLVDCVRNYFVSNKFFIPPSVKAVQFVSKNIKPPFAVVSNTQYS